MAGNKEHEQRTGRLRQALLEGERSGDAGELDMKAIRQKTRQAGQRAFHVSELPAEVTGELGTVPAPEAASAFDPEYKP